MCENETKRRSCTECPQYDGMKCTATDFTLGDRDEVLYQEHRRGFICLDTGEAELKGDAAIQWTAEQERLSQEKGYKSCKEMWDAEGKQVKSGFLIDKDNEHLEPVLQVSNGPGPVKLTFQYEENAKSVDDTMYHPNVVADSTDLHSATSCPHGEPNTFKMTIRLVDSDDSAAGSPSSECPSLQEGPPQKGKIEDSDPLDTGVIVKCGEGIPVLPGTGHYAYDTQICIVENPPPLFTVDLFEPRQKSCISCKHYQDPVCDACGRVIGTMLDLAELEEAKGFHCFAADQMQREE